MLIVTETMKAQGGKWQPMFSRAGKSTVNQYIAFNESAQSRSVEVQNRYSDEDDDDFEMQVESILQEDEDYKPKSTF